MSKRRKIRIWWTCSDYKPQHSHRWYWMAWICGWWQKRNAHLRPQAPRAGVGGAKVAP